jgi:hypothetical protein
MADHVQHEQIDSQARCARPEQSVADLPLEPRAIHVKTVQVSWGKPMFDADKFRRDVERTEAALRAKFHRDSGDLASLMRHAGRRLPPRAHRAAEEIERTQQLAGHPKLAKQLDQDSLKQLFRRIDAAVAAYDGKDHRKGLLLGVLSSMAFNVLVFVALLIAFARWQGLF